MAFNAGQKLTASLLNASLGVSVAGGQERVTTSGAIGATETAWATTTSMTLAANSTYEVMVDATYGGSTSGDIFFMRIRDTNVSGTSRNVIVLPAIVGAGGGPYQVMFSYTFTTSVSASYQFCATAIRNSGSGTMTVSPSSKIVVKLFGSNTVLSTV